ncbi:MAG TPA: glycosyltransferase, partial [Blastocatellia bacterium]
SAGDDPQFLLSGPYPSGWVEVVVHVESPDRYTDHSRLYIDRGKGFSEEDSVDLGEVNTRQSRFAFLRDTVAGLRLDPLENAGRFKLKTLEFFEVTEDEVQQGLSKQSGPCRQPPAAFRVAPKIDPYDAWLEVNRWTGRREQLLHARLATLESPPVISVVMPVYNPPHQFLNLAIQSVVDQVYPRWELCIADDGSPDATVRNLLNEWATREPRIKLVFRENNGGISAASNSAAALATGDYLLFMDNDDAISPDALGEIALYVSDHPDTDAVYADEDKIDAEGRRYDPGFKPDWSPELFLSYNYINHPFVLKKSLFDRLGGFSSRLTFSQDWDLGLRATELARHVGHIPLVLYHWRAIPSSVAFSGKSKPQGLVAARDAIDTAFRRRGMSAEVYQPDWAMAIACAYYAHRFPDTGPGVSILIPSRNNVAVLRACIDSLACTSYQNYEVVIIDNESGDPATLEYLAASPHRVLRIESPGGNFSFADINNRAVDQVSTEFVLFLNDDTEVVSPEWLSQMAGYLGVPGVGAVGARLLYPDGRVQHAGVVHSSYVPGPWHAFRFAESWNPGFMGWSLVARNCSAVTAACMLTRRDLFLELGAFDSKTFPVAYNDVDYCYRLLAAGYRIAYSPTSELTHHESLSRGRDGDPAELAQIFSKYGSFVDKHYSRYLKDTGPVEVAPRTLAVHRQQAVRTLVCTHNLNFEGAPLVQMEITLGLKTQGVIEPVVYSPTDGPLRAQYESGGVRVVVRPDPLWSVAPTVEGYAIGMEVFANWVRKLGVELVYANTLRTFYAIEAATQAGLPSIWNVRESEGWRTYFDYVGPEIAALALGCFAYPYQVIFVSDASKERFGELCSRHNFTTIHDGLDQAKFRAGLAAIPRAAARNKLGLGDDEVAILTVGTVCARKGQLDIVGALEEIDAETAARLRWFVVGERDDGIRLEGDGWHLRSRQSDLDFAKASRLEVVPEMPDVLPYYSAADVFVCTSRIESYPRVILEAMAAGLPIVTTPVFGIVEQVRGGRNAIFYNPGDKRALASAVTRLVNEPGLREKMGAASSSVLASRISHEKMIEAYGNAFKEAWLSGGPRAT